MAIAQTPVKTRLALAQEAFEAHTGEMAQIVLFHHSQGLTEGLRFLARRLEAVGHRVHTPDFFSGKVFSRPDEGLAFAGMVGHDAMEELAKRTAREHKGVDTVIGFSLGAFAAQLLAQEVRSVQRCVLVGGALDPRELQGDWRHGVALSIHLAQPDDWINHDDLDALIKRAHQAEVHTYRGVGHMFADPSHPDYDADAADLFEERLVDWLAPAAN